MLPSPVNPLRPMRRRRRGSRGIDGGCAVPGGQDRRPAMRIIDLSQPMEEGMPVFPTHYPYYLLFRRRHRDLARPDGYGSASDVVTFSPHAGTHIDALGHGSEEGKAFGGIPVEELERGGRGLTALDAAEIGPIWRR